jgi:hypothetical protein
MGPCGTFVFSILCAAAPIGALAAARVAQGTRAAVVVPSSLALVNGTLRVSGRARGIGIWAVLATVSRTSARTPAAGSSTTPHGPGRATPR